MEAADGKKENKGKRFKLFRWKGVLEQVDRRARLVVFLALVIAVCALTFMQFGFVGIGWEGEYAAYAIALLLPVALAALLFGPLLGTAFGLLSGSVLYLHAVVMPIDYYEFTFVTFYTSVVMLAFCGLLAGLLFAIALRNNPTQGKRVIYIVIVCLIVSFVCSTWFVTNVIISLIFDLVEEGYIAADSAEVNDAVVQLNAVTMAFRLGDVGLQTLVDWVVMALVSILGDYAARKVLETAENVSLRSLFGISLFAVFSLAFLVTAASSFVVITGAEYNRSASSMKGEVEYLGKQVGGYKERLNSFFQFTDSLDLDDRTLTEENMAALIKVASIGDLLEGYSSDEDGTVFFTIDDGQIIMSDDENIVVGDNINDFNEDMAECIEQSIANDTVVRFVYDEGNLTDALADSQGYEAIRSQLAYLYAGEYEGYTITIMWPSEKMYENRASVMAWTTVLALVLLVVVFVLTSTLLNRVVVRRIVKTNNVLGEITEGNLEARVDVHGTREFKALSHGINETVGTLKGWIAEAETRMDAELATAKAIQESALPRVFPPYPDIMAFDIYASMNAAKEVGGDFYDFFLVGDDSDSQSGKLGFLIADVSGKGVPAALFMMNAKACIRGYIESGMELGEAIENANRQLCEENDEGMFVTVFAGVLDYATNRVEFVNAGHNPPLIWQEGSWRWLDDKSGMPLGLFDGLPYTAYSVSCSIGDQFLLYTDGVTESMDVNGALYGEDRLKVLVDQNYRLHPRGLIGAVRRDVAAHAEGAVQSDDITMLALEVGVPPEITATLAVRADVEELPTVNRFIHTELDRRLCPLRVQKQLDIAVEELFVNVAHYAYPDATPEDPGTAWVSYRYSAEPPSIIIDIVDEGIPYNPLAKPDAVTPDDIMEVPIGGLGILMAKQSVDEMSYERVDNSNIVSIVKRW